MKELIIFVTRARNFWPLTSLVDEASSAKLGPTGDAYFCIFCICISFLHILHINAYKCNGDILLAPCVLLMDWMQVSVLIQSWVSRLPKVLHTHTHTYTPVTAGLAGSRNGPAQVSESLDWLRPVCPIKCTDMQKREEICTKYACICPKYIIICSKYAQNNSNI